MCKSMEFAHHENLLLITRSFIKPEVTKMLKSLAMPLVGNFAWGLA